MSSLKLVIAIILFFVTGSTSIAQISSSCDLTKFPMSDQCMLELLKNGTNAQLKKVLKIDEKAAETIVKVKNRKLFSSVSSFKNAMPYDIRAKIEIVTIDKSNKQSNTGGINHQGDVIQSGSGTVYTGPVTIYNERDSENGKSDLRNQEEKGVKKAKLTPSNYASEYMGVTIKVVKCELSNYRLTCHFTFENVGAQAEINYVYHPYQATLIDDSGNTYNSDRIIIGNIEAPKYGVGRYTLVHGPIVKATVVFNVGNNDMANLSKLVIVDDQISFSNVPVNSELE